MGRAGERREKSLGLLSQRFVQIFMQSPDNHTVPLDTAAETLLGEVELQQPERSLQCHGLIAPAAHVSSTWDTLYVMLQHDHAVTLSGN